MIHQVYFAFLCLTISLVPQTFAQVSTQTDSSKIYIDVGDAQIKKSLLAFPQPTYVGRPPVPKAHLEAGTDLFKVIENNLLVSGLFTFIKPQAFLEDPDKVGLRPAPQDPKGFRFSNWSTIGAEFLVRSAYRVIGTELSFEVYVYHVPQAKLILGRTYKGPTARTRTIAHTFSNELMQELTGKRGIFLTKVVASRQSNSNGKLGHKEIVVMDWDGHNQQQITNDKSIAVSPAWHPNGKMIAYTSFAYHTRVKVRNADLFTYELDTKRRLLVSYRKGINSGAAFSPSGDFLYLTLSQGGSPDIFRMTLDGKNLTPITKGPNKAMNVEPSISPDGKKIAFSTDRSGQPMIYIMNTDGSNADRITFAGKYNASPAWSPDGQQLVFAGHNNGNFDIFLINADKTGLKKLTDATRPNGKKADNESPSWSPDGRHIMFTSNRTGLSQIYVITKDGTNERQLTFDRSYIWDKPKWSPYLDSP